jgi:predicted dehydrogenase
VEKINMDKIRFAFVGCGRISRKHAEIIAKQIPEAILTADCDTSSNRAEECAGSVVKVQQVINV